MPRPRGSRYARSTDEGTRCLTTRNASRSSSTTRTSRSAHATRWVRGRSTSGPIAEALAERGRVVVRRAYADWTRFDEDRRDADAPSRRADRDARNAWGSCARTPPTSRWRSTPSSCRFERGYITTFVLGTGDSDFTPLVHKLRELNRRVIGIGVEASTSALLPPACDEFLFYERLEGVEPGAAAPVESTDRAEAPRAKAGEEAVEEERARRARRGARPRRARHPHAGRPRAQQRRHRCCASALKRTILRKDPTFSEADYGFRGFGELLRNLGRARGRRAVSRGAPPATRR